MKKVIIIAIVAAICFAAQAYATIINIPDDYPTIQTGINASSDGDTVLVQPGTYVENINFNGHNIVLGSLFLMTGDTTYIADTIIDGDSAGTVVTFGNDTIAVLTGFTIQNGSGDFGGGIFCSGSTITENIIKENYAYRGGGIHCEEGPPVIISNNVITENSSLNDGGGISFSLFFDGPATVKNNTIIGNSSGGRGGGISQNGDSVITVLDNLIIGNSADDGGGICSVGNHSIINNTIRGNSASHHVDAGIGGGIFCGGGSPIIRYNTITENSSDYAGGGIFFYEYGSPVIENNLISENISANLGGGIVTYGNNSPIINNNTVSNNSADIAGGGYYCADNSSPVFINTIFWANTARTDNEIHIDGGTPEFIYCDIQDTLWPGIGNVSVEPLFRDALNHDYHLMSTTCGDLYDSPCIDTGAPTILDSLLDCSWGLGAIASD
ncbi:MAG: right-handed parallel beta-helix repeat-containing protein, partial [candidate division Zixibacteria bacterium]